MMKLKTQAPPLYAIHKDGKPLAVVQGDLEAMQWFHKNTIYSMYNAQRQGGYEIVKMENTEEI